MKRIDLKLGLAVCAGIVTLFGASTDVFANTHAGISKLISNCLYQTQGLVIADSDVTLSKAAPAEENEQPQADAEEKEEVIAFSDCEHKSATDGEHNNNGSDSSDKEAGYGLHVMELL